jgi:site-specific recombinase XerD
LQRAVKRAARRASILKPASVDTLHHSFATLLLESGYDIRIVPRCSNVKTTMIYTHVLNRGGSEVVRSLDAS